MIQWMIESWAKLHKRLCLKIAIVNGRTQSAVKQATANVEGHCGIQAKREPAQ